MGNTLIEINSAPIDSQKLLEILADPQCGAEVLFSGKVREQNNGKKVLAVSYDAQIPLAKKTLEEICTQAKESWGESINIVVAHRLGRLTVGEASVFIGVSSPHRDEAYQASRYIIEQLKVRVPIWKKEHYEDGETKWLKGHALCQHHHGSSARRGTVETNGPG